MAQLVVHHLDWDRTNNKLENLLVICRRCHKKIKPPQLRISAEPRNSHYPRKSLLEAASYQCQLCGETQAGLEAKYGNKVDLKHFYCSLNDPIMMKEKGIHQGPQAWLRRKNGSIVFLEEHSGLPWVLSPNFIIAVRLALKLTQDQLARKIGMTQAYLSMLERGARSPNYQHLYKIACLFQSNAIFRFVDTKTQEVEVTPVIAEQEISRDGKSYRIVDLVDGTQLVVAKEKEEPNAWLERKGYQASRVRQGWF